MPVHPLRLAIHQLWFQIGLNERGAQTRLRRQVSLLTPPFDNLAASASLLLRTAEHRGAGRRNGCVGRLAARANFRGDKRRYPGRVPINTLMENRKLCAGVRSRLCCAFLLMESI